jgi:hypothetical protein
MHHNKNAVLVLGYNNTRIDDVRKIKKSAKSNLDAITVLCKSAPTQADLEAADLVIDVGLRGTAEEVQKVKDALVANYLSPVALLPFSDPGTQLGAALSHALNLRGADPELIRGALDKHSFRTLEARSSAAPSGYRKVASTLIHSLAELVDTYDRYGGQGFLKPAQEGNSRGCIHLSKQADLQNAWDQVSIYADGGIVLEELIEGGAEYSWDQVNGYAWITEKKTTQDAYRAEYQQIVPAPLSENHSAKLSETGAYMSGLVGNGMGACHNELFLFASTDETVAVEPNLRPGGMRIWDLASLAFRNFNPWDEWIRWAAGAQAPGTRALERQFYAGIRYLRSGVDGLFPAPSTIAPDTDAATSNCELIEVVWTRKPGDKVSSSITNNADYVGYFILRAEKYEDLCHGLDAVADALENQLSSLVRQ